MTTDIPPAQKVEIKRIIHTIHAVTDVGRCRRKYLDMFGGQIFAESYYEPEDRDMALLYVTNHMIEPMAPRDPSRDDKPYARYLKRYGQGFHSFEIKVKNGPEAAAFFKEAGCRLASDYGVFFFVREESTGGVMLEVTELPMPNDPYDRRGWRDDWSNGHPSGLLCLDHIACISPNVDAAVRFFTQLCDGEVLSDETAILPQPGRRVCLQLGDTRVAFIQPDDRENGILAEFLKPPTSGVYALVWRAENEAAAETFFQQKGLRTTRDGCVSPGFAIEPADFLGARHEFIGSR